jgi:hypothetical protein
MAKPYSLDLGERVVVRVVAGEPVRLVTRRFGVSASSVVKWSQRFRATGSAAAGKMGGMSRSFLSASTAAGFWTGSSGRTSPCVALSPSLPNAASRSMTGRCGSFVHAERLSFRAPGHASATCSTPSPKTNVVVISLMQETLQYKIIPI